MLRSLILVTVTGVLLGAPAASFAGAQGAASGGISFVEPLVVPPIFAPNSIGQLPVGSQGVLGLAKGDFNGDGKLDLAATGGQNEAPPAPENGFVYVMLGLGDGRFQPPTKLLVPRQSNGNPSQAVGLLAKDFDRDDELDLLTVSNDLRAVLFYKGLGNGNFNPPLIGTAGNGLIGVQAAQLNDDDILDLVTHSTFGSSTIEIWIGNGDGTFQPPVARTTGTGQNDLALADFNGDQAPDILVSSFGHHSLYILLNDGEGGFPIDATSISIPLTQPFGFYVGRFDADDNLDLVVMGFPGDCGNGWQFLKGNGDGTFAPANASGCTPNIGLVGGDAYQKNFFENIAPDLNDDGLPDVIFRAIGNHIAVGLNDGNGRFNVALWVATSGPGYDHNGHSSVDPTIHRSFIPGDFNGDEVIDVAVSSQACNLCRPGGVSLLLGDTPGTFRAPRSYDTGLTLKFGAHSSLLADFDNDDISDHLVRQGICFGANCFDAMRVIKGSGDGTILNAPLPLSGAPCTHAPRAADFDKDGNLDLFCGVTRGGNVSWGNGTGAFDDSIYIPISQAIGGIEVEGTAVGDVNNDSYPDVALYQWNFGTGISVHLYDPNNPRHFIQTAAFNLGSVGIAFGRPLAFGDLNGDSFLDLVTHSTVQPDQTAGERLLVYRGRGDGTFLDPLISQPGLGGFPASQITPIDLNRDGFLDLLNATPGGINVLLGNGDATFQPQVFYATTAGNGVETEVADFDGDGALDVVLSSGFFGFSSPLSIFKGNGDGTFKRRTRWATGEDGTATVDVGDLNGDGKPDLVVGVGGNHENFTVLINGGFLPDLEVSQVMAPASAVPGNPITINYEVRNDSDELATGEWDDALYLSADATLDDDDLLIGTIHVNTGAGPGGSYSRQLTAPLPGEVAGPRFVLVRTDVNGDLGETDEANNTNTTPITVLDIPVLQNGVAFNGMIAAGQFRYFRYTPQVDSDLLFRGNFELPNEVEFYVRAERPPSRTQFDLKSATPANLQQDLNVPITLGEPYYVLLYGAPAAGTGQMFTITASELGLAITSLSLSTGSNLGSVTVTIRGAKFTSDTDLRLKMGNVERLATRIVFNGPDELVATFNLIGLQPGSFDLVAEDGERQFTLPSGFQVIVGIPGRLEASIIMPETMLPGWTLGATVTIRNVGDTDIKPGLFIVRIKSDNAAFAQRDGSDSTMEIFIPGGPDGVVPARGEITQIFHFHCTEPTNPRDVEVELAEMPNITDVDDDIEQFKRDLKPAYVPDDAWDAVWQCFTGRAGENLERLSDVLNEDAAYLNSIGEGTADLSQLLSYELSQCGLPHIVSRYLIGAFGRGRPAPWELTATADEDGNVLVRLGTAARNFSRQSNGTFKAATGDNGKLTAAGGGYSLREGEGLLLSFRPDGLLDYTEDTSGNRFTNNYSGGRVTSRTHSNGEQEVIAYNGQGRVASITDFAGRVTTYGYDASGEHLLSIANPLGTIAYTYVSGANAVTRHAIASITTPDNTTQVYSYDAVHGRMTLSRRMGGGAEVSFAYPSVGCSTETSSRGTSTVCSNAGNQPARVVDALGRTTLYSHDAANNLTKVVWPDGRTSEYAFDRRGNVMTEKNRAASTNELMYDVFFNQLLRTKDSRGNTTLYGYDLDGNLIRVTYPGGASELFDYDADGRVAAWTNRRGQTVTFARNAFGDVISKTVQGSMPIQYGYDARRNLTAITDASGTTENDYDADDRLTRVTYPDGRFLEFEYDAVNRRSRAADQDGFAIRYEYDAVGRLSRVTDDGGDPFVTYSYDSADRLIEEAKGNGTSTNYSYDSISRLRRIENRGLGDVVQSFFEYTYDVLDRPVSIVSAEGATSLSYDNIGQLTEVQLPGGRTVRYQYDSAGNRVSVNDNGTVTNYSTNALNQYTTVGDATLTYDTDGNLATRGSTTYSYDVENRLVGINSPGSSYAFEYDAKGVLNATVFNGARTEFLIDPAGFFDIFAEYAGGGLRAHHVHANGLISSVDAGDSASYFGFDSAGNTAQITDAAATAVNNYRYLPFGEQTSANENLDNSYTFGGKWGLREVGGLQYVRNRWYDPSIGRFLTRDPAGVDGGDLNLYRYVLNSPARFVDPLGLAPGGIPGPATGPLAPLTTTEFMLEANAAVGEFAAGATFYGEGGAALVSSSSTYGVAEGLFATGSAELARKELQGIGIHAANKSLQTATTQAAARGSSGVLARAAVGFATANPYLKYGLALTAATQFVLHNTGPGRRLDNAMYRSILRNELKQYDLRQDHVLESKTIQFAGRRYGDPFLEKNYILHDDYSVTRKRSSFDPNILIGPAGFGPENWIIGGRPLPYTARFENLATATAAAATIVVTQQLDPDLDPETFELGGIGWADLFVEVPPGSKAFSKRVDFQEETGLFVDVEASIDTTTSMVTWRLQAIDPATGEPPGPESPTEGFLLPNDASRRGEGFVDYRVAPRAGSPTGTRIDAQARIVFDLNAPIDTPPIFHTLDLDTPTSAVNMLATTTPSGAVQLTWNAEDLGSGIALYNVYVSVDDGPFNLFADRTTMTSATYQGENGHRYGFYVVAVDNVGHTEVAPAEADATTQVVIGPPTPTAPPPLTPTPTPLACVGDCSGEGAVTVDEVVRGVNIALGTLLLDECPSFDRSGEGQVTVDELIAAVTNALSGCR